MRDLLTDFIHLFFPMSCLACESSLVHSEKVLCTYCLGSLPNVWEDHVMQDLAAKNFWGYIPVEKAVALFSFTKKGAVQNILHKVKYKNRTESLKQLGKYCGLLWQGMPKMRSLDAIVPVPLHRKRLQERGYNQSYLFAQGMSTMLYVPCKQDWLERTRHTPSQTTQLREERVTNVAKAFTALYTDQIKGKHILLVDDLVTTGATLRACAETLLNAGAAHISVAVLAVAV